MYIKKTYKCVYCGTKDINRFYVSRKNKCKKCILDSYKEERTIVPPLTDIEDIWSYFEDGAEEELHQYVLTVIIPELYKEYKRIYN